MLYKRLLASAGARPARTFVIEAESGRTLSYRQTLAGVRSLRLLLGETPCRIGLALPSGIPNALIWLSALSGGHTLIPFPPDAPEAERRRLAARFTPNVLVVEHRADAASFGCPCARVLTQAECDDAILAMETDAHDHPLPDAGGSVCLTTSGSTGEPKGVCLSERQVVWTAEQVLRTHALGPDDCGLTVLPFFHVNAPVVSLCSSLLAGGTVVIARRFSRHAFWNWVERYHVTWVSLVPTILAFLLQTERPGHLPGKLRFVRSASAPLPVVQMKAFERKFGIPVVETYGLTEAASQVTANPVPPGLRKVGSVGLPTGLRVRICQPRERDATGATIPLEAAPDLRDVAPGAVGEICVSGPSVISAYMGDAAPDAFHDGWFRTGDLGYRDADGYLFITGRLRDVIIRGGENISPREVEETLLSDPLVADVAVVGEPDPLYGQQVVAYVVPAKSSWNADKEATLLARCAAQLASYKVPAHIVRAPSLPRTRSGKIQRHLLRSLAPVRVAG